MLDRPEQTWMYLLTTTPCQWSASRTASPHLTELTRSLALLYPHGCNVDTDSPVEWQPRQGAALEVQGAVHPGKYVWPLQLMKIKMQHLLAITCRKQWSWH